MPQTQLIVLLVRCLLLIAVAPWLLAVGFGVHSAPGGAQEGWLLRVLFVSSDPLAIVELLGRSGALALAAAGLGVAAIAARTLERTRWGSSLIALPEAALALAGLVASAGVLAVGMAIDRPLFWGGLAILMLAWRPRPRPPRWTADDNASWRLILLVASAAVVLLAGETLLEGPGQRSPAFLLRGWWTNGPGQSGWTSGGIWLGLGIACVACARRGVGMGRVAAAVAVAGGVISTQGGPAEHYTIAAVTSAIGLLLVAWGLPAWIGDLPAPRGGPDVLDPRRLLSHAVPVIAWAAICAARGLTCFMWTVPTALPPGVTQIAQHGDVFSLGVDPGSGAVIYTDRERSRLGVLVDGVDREFDLGSTGPEEVLVLGPGAVWVSLVGHRGSGLVAVDLDTGPDVPARSVPGGCWIAGLFPMPEAAAEAAGLPSGSVAVGCEDAARLWLARQPLEIDGSRIVPHAVEEAVFAADGRSLYTVGLWSGWSLDRLAWLWWWW